MFICFVSSDIPSYFHLKNVKNSREWSSGDEFANHDVVGGQKTHTFHMLILPLIPVAILLIQGQTGHFFPHIVSLPLGIHFHFSAYGRSHAGITKTIALI